MLRTEMAFRSVANCHVSRQFSSFVRSLGKEELILTAILEFAEVCLNTYNIPQASKLLKQAAELLSNVRCG